jgi:two-component system, cell cycle sensor histidine kinase and response regulator CckA
MKILVVEDDENSRVYLERALKSQNYTIESAANGILALEKALLSPPDMIISDILMPEMGGFDFCRKVKANEQLQHIPFIFYTATFIDKKDEELAISLGASRFIVKPFNMEELFEIITDVIEEHKEKKQPVPEKTLVEIEKIDEMYSGTIARKLDKKVAQLQKEIVERKQAEATLHQSEEKFSKAFHATPDAIEITRISDERLIDVNDVFVGRTGYSRDEVVGHTTLEFNLWVNPQDRERYFSTIREQGSVREQESQFRMKSGEILDGLVSGETFSIGEEKYILTIIRDITIRKQAEEELKKYH